MLRVGSSAVVFSSGNQPESNTGSHVKGLNRFRTRKTSLRICFMKTQDLMPEQKVGYNYHIKILAARLPALFLPRQFFPLMF